MANSPKKSAKAEKKQSKFDAYVNNYTGLGLTERDNSISSFYERTTFLTDPELETMYHDNAFAARICDLVPDEAMKQGFTIETEEKEDASKDDLALKNSKSTQKKNALDGIMMTLDDLSAKEKITDALVWSRVFGGAAVYVGLDDGNPEDMPVDETNIRSVKFLSVLDRRDLLPVAYYTDPATEKFGTPSLYRLLPQASNGAAYGASVPDMLIHADRLLLFKGTRTSKRRQQQNRGWSESILQKLNDVLVQYGVSWQATSHLMVRAPVGIFKMYGVIEAMASGSPEYVERRLTDLQMNMSVVKDIYVDAENGEDFKRETYSFNGIPQILEMMMFNVCSAVGIPATLLFGRAPAGMNSTGDADFRAFYDKIKGFQKQTLKPQLEKLIHWIMISKEGPTKGKELKKWAVCFPPAWQMTETEQASVEAVKATTRKTNAEATLLEMQIEAKEEAKEIGEPDQTAPPPPQEMPLDPEQPEENEEAAEEETPQEKA